MLSPNELSHRNDDLHNLFIYRATAAAANSLPPPPPPPPPPPLHLFVNNPRLEAPTEKNDRRKAFGKIFPICLQ